MEIAPLIHSRTYYCDFNMNFAVRPSDIDVNRTMKKVLLAMSEVDILRGVRRLVAYENNICIAGIACTLRYFAENYLNDSDAEDYFQDKGGRDVKIFLGFAFKGNRNEIPNVNYSDIWQMFKDNLAPLWKNSTVETVVADYKNCSAKNISGNVSFIKAGNIDFCESNESTDEKVFAQCMAERKNLCTNADQDKIIVSGEFEVISTTKSLINKHTAESEKKTSITQSQQIQSKAQSFQGQRIQRREIPIKKNNQTGLIIVAAVIVIAVILFLLIN